MVGRELLYYGCQVPEYTSVRTHSIAARHLAPLDNPLSRACSLSRSRAPSAIRPLLACRRGRASQHVVVVVVVHGGDVGRRPGAPRATAGLRRHPHPTLHGRGLSRLVVAAVVVVRGVVVPAARRLVVGRRPGWAGWAEGQGRDCNWSWGWGRGRGLGSASGSGLGVG